MWEKNIYFAKMRMDPDLGLITTNIDSDLFMKEIGTMIDTSQHKFDGAHKTNQFFVAIKKQLTYF